jgi:hypothetical protein
MIPNRLRAVLAILLLVACGPAVDKPVGGRDLAVDTDCPEPYRSWIADEAGEFGWHLTEVGEFTVHCGDTGPKGGAEQYDLGTNTVTLDTTKIRTLPEFQTKAYVAHGWTHRLIYFGPRPEMATLHICDVAYNETYPPGCVEGISSKNAIMSPGGTDWDGTSETFTLTTVPPSRPTYEDLQFIERALRP